MFSGLMDFMGYLKSDGSRDFCRIEDELSMMPSFAS
jgi:hypothetical protein